MMSFRRCAWIAVVVATTPLPAVAQLSGSNFFEFQVGNTPFTDPADLTSGFNQLNAQYSAGELRAAVRLEQFYTRFREREYQRLSQYRLSYHNSGAEIVVGHFYDMLGRGLLLRAYEIPGVVLEDVAFRVRSGFYRDVHGVQLGYRTDAFSVKAMRGKPLVNVLPPTIPESDRRTDLVEAIDASVNAGARTFGAAFLRNNAGGDFAEYASVSAGGLVAGPVSGYVELARQVGDRRALTDFGDDQAYALYASTAFARGSFGVSLEYKNYSDFFLGSGFNDPPSLIKEHTYAILNRSTHVMSLNDESGTQLEVYYGFHDGSRLTVNATRALNEFTEDYVYQEYFAEYFAYLGDHTSAKIFADFAEDPFKAEEQRFSAGTYADRILGDGWSGAVDVEFQTFMRTIGEGARVTNYLAGLTVSRSTRYSAGVVWERSTDPLLADDPTTVEVETDPRNWVGVTASFRPSGSHTIALFAGTRRGGPACTSGICYEVLDFEGVELRVTSRF